MRARADVGETLIEILFTIVIIGLTATALLSSLAAAGKAGNVQRSSVQADYILRNYATVAKSAAQQCVASAPYSAPYVAALPAGFSVGPIPSGTLCPLASSSLPITLTVAGPLGLSDSVVVVIRTP
jgi:type II secretory pathway pseudopilin PulG